MAFQLTINGADYTDYLDFKSVQITESISANGGSATMDILIKSREVTAPVAGNSLILYQNSPTRAYAGRITNVRSQAGAGFVDVRYSLSCTGYAIDLNKLIGSAQTVFPAQLCGDLVKQVVATAGLGFTTTNVADGITMAEQQVDREEAASLISKWVQSIEHQWYVDYYRDVHVFFVLDRAAPVPAIDLDSDTTSFSNFSYEESWEQVKNRIYLVGGSVKSSNQDSVAATGDGTTKFFALNYQPWDMDSITVTLNGTPQTLLYDGLQGQAGDSGGSAGQSFICLTESQEVLTDQGYKRIALLEPGGLVSTHLGCYKPIIRTFKLNYEGPIYHIKRFGWYRPLEATADHPILAVNGCETIGKVRSGRNNRPYPVLFSENMHKYVRAEELRIGDFVVEPLCGLPQHDDPTITEDDMFVLGLYAAEGYLAEKRGQNSNSVIFALHQSEVHYSELIAKVGGREAHVYQQKGSRGITITVSSARLRLLCETIGKGAYNKRVPDWIFQLPKNKQAAFIRGYWVGDGCVSSREIVCDSVSLNLLDGTRRLLLLHGIIGKLSKLCNTVMLPTDRLFDREIYHLAVAGRSANALAALLLLPDWRILKGRRYNSFIVGNYAYYRIEDIKKIVGHTTVYDIEVADDHSFVAEGMAQSNCFDNWGVRFPDNNPPGNGLPLEISYNYSYEPIIVVEDPISIATMKALENSDEAPSTGIHELKFSVPDIRVTSEDALWEYGQLLLLRYATKNIDIEFDSWVQGWEIGQTFTISSASTKLNLSGRYYINEVAKTIRRTNPAEFTYHIKASNKMFPS